MVGIAAAPQINCLADLIRDRARLDPDLDVLTFVDVDVAGGFHDEVRTYRNLWDNGRALAQALITHGLEPGDRFAIILQNHPEFVEAMIAASITHTVFVPIDPRTSGARLVHMLELARCQGAIVGDYCLDNLQEIRGALTNLRWAFVVGGGKTGAHAGENTIHIADVVNTPLTIDAFHATDERELMQLLYTSGTTGDPKAIATRHARFINAGPAASLFGFRPGDRPYTGLSLTHANAQMVTLSAILHLGLRGVISRKFTKSRLWDITRRYGCTVFNLLGGMTVELYGEPVRANDSDNPVRLVISAGMPAVIWEEFRRRFGVEILEFYGAAEGGLTINPPGVGPVGSVGKPPLGIQVGILDAMGQPCAPGEIGEICFRLPGGEAPAVDYEGDSVASARKLAGGWLHMGDIGYLDNEGWLFFHHREGGGIRRNGEFIDATATESAIARHPDVSDVFVYGVPAGSAVPGEKDLVAAVVSTNRACFDPQRLFEHCRAVLERRFVPRYLQLVDEIPKTASQKPQERILFKAFSPDAANVYVEAPQLNALRCERH